MADIRRVATQAARNCALRITSAGMSAFEPARRSTTAKATSSTTHSANRPRMRASVQPHSVTWSSANSSDISPTVSVVIPR